MCGIIGATATRNIVGTIVDGIKNLDYRGYDSCGIAVVNGALCVLRRVGDGIELEKALKRARLEGCLAIGHARWATHGRVTEANAHPHVSDGIAVVHNGIIENHDELRAELEAKGYVFRSETDTETIVHLVHDLRRTAPTLLAAVQQAMGRLQGAYAVVFCSLREPDRLVVARKGSPLLIGLGEGANFVASDVRAVVAATRRVVYLEEGDTAEVATDHVAVFDQAGVRVERQIHLSEASASSLTKGPYDHFMQKEIHEQPKALHDTIEPMLGAQMSPRLFGATSSVFARVERVLLLACGTSYYAGTVARQWLESIARVPARVEVASEYRYRDVVREPRELVVTISQSGETADTLEALRRAKALGAEHTLCVCNVKESSIPRESEFCFYTNAGPEVGVASTKAFTTQLSALFGLALSLAKARGRLSAEAQAEATRALRHIPGSVQHALNLEEQIKLWARNFMHKEHALFLGRGIHLSVAHEGALKLKEISYIHAEAYPAGELKHGPLALVDEHMPVVVVAPSDALFDKVQSNMQEVRARGGELYVFADLGSKFAPGDHVHVIRLPRHDGLLSPIMHTVPLQLLAYHAAVFRGKEIDKPRNLAKSVTVE